MKDYRKTVSDLATRRYMLLVALTALGAFGFAAFNKTYNVDDLQVDYYIGSEQTMLAAGRFTMTLLGVLFNYTRSLPAAAYMIDLMAVLSFAWAALTFCVLFRRICGEKFTDNAAVLFSCLLISYPLIIEIWEFTAANLNVTVGYLLDAFALLMIYSFFHGEKKWQYPALAAFLLMFVCASYESGVVVYVFGVFTVLFLQVIYGSREEKSIKTILMQGIFYAAVLVAALILKVVAHKLILVLGSVEATTNGQRQIFWLSRSPKEALLTMMAGILSQIFLRGIIYFPVTELLVACVIFLIIGIVLCRKHGAVILLPWAGMYLSLILLPLLQGAAPMYRTCQVYGMFVALVGALVAMGLEGFRFPKIRALAFFLAGFLCLHQVLYVNYFLTLNHERSDAENQIVADIGSQLQRSFDTEKPVIFVGTYVLSDALLEAASISETSLRWKIYRELNLKLSSLSPERFEAAAQVRLLPDTVIQSILQFGVYAPGQKAMQNLFSYNGFDYVLADYHTWYDTAVEYVYGNDMPAYPREGYIADMGECIVVHLGE